MRFLGSNAEGRNVMPLNIIYDNPKDDKDMLMILYKDINTGEKFVKNIEEPEIVVYVVKEQYRGKPEKDNPLNVDGTYHHDFFSKEQVDAITVKYRKRLYEVGKILGIKYDQVNSSPFVAGTDITIENWYFIEFLHEYGNDMIKPLNIGYFDIECDSRGIGRSEIGTNYGKMTITCLTYICESRKQCFHFILNNPECKSIDKVINNLDEFKKELENTFSPDYPGFEYSVLVFEKEIDLIATFWQLVRVVGDDFIEAWNAPFDVGNLTFRSIELGYDAKSIICDKDFARDIIEFKEDRSTFLVHKKKHIMKYSLKSVIKDQMNLYAGVRSGKSKLPSTALDKIAESEGFKGKIKYTGDINEFYMNDAWNFFIYNVNDVFVQYGVGQKARDVDDIYSRMYESGNLDIDIFSSTSRWANYIKKDLEERRDMILCNNKNRYKVATAEIIELGFDSDSATVEEAEADEVDGEDDDVETLDLEKIMENIEDQQTLIDKTTGKKKKFAGAIVLDTRRTKWTGKMINGRKSNYVHDNAIDEDITSEYPTAISISNQSNDTFVGKVFMDNPDDINLPFFSQYSFLDKADAAGYKMNKAALMMETALQGDYLIAGEISLGLPNITELENLLMNDKMFKI